MLREGVGFLELCFCLRRESDRGLTTRELRVYHLPDCEGVQRTVRVVHRCTHDYEPRLSIAKINVWDADWAEARLAEVCYLNVNLCPVAL